MKVIIIGAHGKVGQCVTKQMQESEDFDPTAFIRKQEQTDFFAQLGVPCVLASLENSVEEIARAISGFDAVVFTAGSGANTGDDKTLEVDLDGAVKTMLAAKKEGVKRFIMVSAAFADDRSKWAASGLKPYYVAKHFADAELQRSDLEYTIIRPVGLTEDKGTGKITTREDKEKFNFKIPREDVARVILEVLRNENAIGKTYEISSGPYPIPKLFEL